MEIKIHHLFNIHSVCIHESGIHYSKEQYERSLSMDNQFDSEYPQDPRIPPQNTPEPRRKRQGGSVIALALCFSLLGSALGAGGVLLASGLRNGPSNTDTPAQESVTHILSGIRENSDLQITEIETGALLTPAEVYAANVHSTVGITTSITTNFWGYQTTSAASGSGFILSPDGYILTNFHVVEDSSTITVRLYNGESLEAALVGYDKSNDIAVLKVEAEDLTPVILGDSDNMNVGDSVVAIGNPLGELTFSLTAGAVSALNREITMSSGSTMNLIQTDCAINSGNSGGALFNLYGEVVGITNAKYSSSGGEASIDNIGFAIPINHVRSLIESIIEKGYISKPYIGVSVASVSPETQSYGLPQGAAVKVIAEESPAEAAGLQINDIITAINGNAITGSSDLVKLVGECAPGDILTLTVFRGGSTLELTLTVGEKIQSALEQSTEPQQPSQAYPGWGFGGFGN